MAEQLKYPDASTTIPWPLIGANATAMSLLFFTAGHFLPLAVMMLLFIMGAIVKWRLPAARSTAWTVRSLAFTFVAILIGIPEVDIVFWYLKQEYTNLIGCLLCAELVIRAYESGPVDHGAILLLSGLILAAGSNTYDKLPISVLVPMYTVFVIFSMRSFLGSRKVHLPLVMMRLLAAAIAIGLGFVIIQSALRVNRELEIYAGDFFRRHAPSASDIGLSTSPRLGSVFNPDPSMERVMVLQGPARERHLRVLAFDTLDRNQWLPALLNTGRGFAQLSTDELAGSHSGQTLRCRIVGDTFDLLPLPLNSAGITAATGIDRDFSGDMKFRGQIVDPRFQVVVSDSERFQGLLCLPLTKANRDGLLRLPTNFNTEVSALAKRVAGQGEAIERVYRIARQLRADHGYDLAYIAHTDDPLAEFILSKRSAHCEYFASAMVVMARAAGVPARFVTGYLAHERGGENWMVIRDRDAHAWAECWIDGTGWITIDATPSGGLPDARFGEPSRWRLAWESVVDFPSTLREWLGALPRKYVFATIFIASGLALITQLIQWRRNRRKSTELPYARPQPELIAVAQRFAKWMREQGATARSNETWRESVRTLVVPSVCAEFLMIYDEARFGGANGQTILRLNHLLNDLETKTGSMKHG